MWFLIVIAALNGQPTDSKENIFLFEKTHSSLEACVSYAQMNQPDLIQYVFTNVFPIGTPVEAFCVDKSTLSKLIGQEV